MVCFTVTSPYKKKIEINLEKEYLKLLIQGLQTSLLISPDEPFRKRLLKIIEQFKGTCLNYDAIFSEVSQLLNA